MAANPMTALLTPEGQLGVNPQSNMLLNMFKGALTGANANALSDADRAGILEQMADMLGGDRLFSTGRKRPAMATGEFKRFDLTYTVYQNQSYHLHLMIITMLIYIN